MGVTLQPGNPEQVGMSVQQTKHAIELSESWVEKGIHDSLAILVARKGVVVIHEAIGQQTPEPNSTPLESDALFPLASISKAITATAVMILVQDGLLSPERPVSEYIPEFAGKDKEKVMVHHLLTHTSGLRDEFEFNIDVYGYALKLMDELGDRWRSSVEIPPLDDNQHPMLNEYLSIRYKQPL